MDIEVLAILPIKLPRHVSSCEKGANTLICDDDDPFEVCCQVDSCLFKLRIGWLCSSEAKQELDILGGTK